MKKKTKRNIMSIFLIIVFVFISVILADKSYNLKNYESLSYKETIATNYKVYLSDNSYYNTQYLDEGMQYISNIIDYVDVTFSYITNFADSLNYNAKTRAEAVVTIVDPDDNNKVIYTSTEALDNISEDSDTGSTRFFPRRSPPPSLHGYRRRPQAPSHVCRAFHSPPPAPVPLEDAFPVSTPAAGTAPGGTCAVFPPYRQTVPSRAARLPPSFP